MPLKSVCFYKPQSFLTLTHETNSNQQGLLLGPDPSGPFVKLFGMFVNLDKHCKIKNLTHKPMQNICLLCPLKISLGVSVVH